MRKKEEQASFLHIYHHVVSPILMWLGVKYIGGRYDYKIETIVEYQAKYIQGTFTITFVSALQSKNNSEH